MMRATNALFFIDRSQSSNGTMFENRTKDAAKMPLGTPQNQVSLKIMLDKTSIEIFYNNGEKLMTEIFFPNNPITSITIENIMINQFDFK